MFDLGLWEVLVIFLIGLLILGPERMARTARVLGYWIGRARGAFNAAKSEVERELRIEDLRKAGDSIRKEVDGIGRQVEEEGRQVEKVGWDFEKEVAEVRRKLQTGIVDEPLSSIESAAEETKKAVEAPKQAEAPSNPPETGAGASDREADR